MCIFFLSCTESKKKKSPQNKLVKGIKAAALRAGDSVMRVGCVRSGAQPRQLLNWASCPRGAQGALLSVPTHSSTGNISRGAKQCQLK